MEHEGNQVHRVFWALWLCQWQGVLRSGDIIRDAKDKRRGWEPERDTHRGRLSVDIGRDVVGRVLCARIKLSLKPTKNDQAGESGLTIKFIVDRQDGALSAGTSLYAMLKGGPVSGPVSSILLFRHPGTSREVTYDESRWLFERVVGAVGFPERNQKLHSFRIGGAMGYANIPGGVEMMAELMGAWQSDAKRLYMWGCQAQVDGTNVQLRWLVGMTILQDRRSVSRPRK